MTKYPDIDKLISELRQILQDSLGTNLKGLYLFGSLVGGDFDAELSDIDLATIVEHVITPSELAELKNVHAQFIENHPEWDNRIEVAYVSVEGMKHFKTKSNKIARISPGEELHMRDMDIDWLMDWHMVQEQGITVFGQQPSTFIPHITEEEYVQSIKNILPDFAESAKGATRKGHQAYIVMSFCRNLYAIKHGKQVSKVAGAKWAAGQYPQWSEFINEAASWRGSQDQSDNLDTQKTTIEFAQFDMDASEKVQ